PGCSHWWPVRSCSSSACGSRPRGSTPATRTCSRRCATTSDEPAADGGCGLTSRRPTGAAGRRAADRGRRRSRRGTAGRAQVPLHHQRIDAAAADPVVAATAIDLPVAGRGVDGAGAGVVLAHLEQHPLGAALPGLLLAPAQQGAADPPALLERADGV